MGPMGAVRDEQRQLLKRIEQLVRLIKRDLCYGGSKDTADLGGAVHERLLQSPNLRRKFDDEPSTLRGLLRTMVRHVLIDEIRSRSAQKRAVPEGDQLRVEWLQQCGRGPARPTPELEHNAQRRRDVQLVMEELERFRLGQDDSRVARDRRARMHDALMLHWQGLSHAEIAVRLGLPKSTVGHSIDALSVMLARRVVTATSTTTDARPVGDGGTARLEIPMQVELRGGC